MNILHIKSHYNGQLLRKVSVFVVFKCHCFYLAKLKPAFDQKRSATRSRTC